MAKPRSQQESAVIPIKSDAQKKTVAPDAGAASGELAKPKKRGKWRIVFLVLLLVIVAGVVAAWLMMSEDTASASVVARPPEPEKPAQFVPLDQFTVNLQSEGADQYLQTSLVVKAGNNATVEAVKQHMPEIRYRLIIVLSSKRPSELATAAGKQALMAEITTTVKQIVAPAVRDDIAAVFFTNFVVQ